MKWGRFPGSGASSCGLIVTSETQETFAYFQAFPSVPSLYLSSGTELEMGQEGLPQKQPAPIGVPLHCVLGRCLCSLLHAGGCDSAVTPSRSSSCQVRSETTEVALSQQQQSREVVGLLWGLGDSVG